MQFRVSRDDQEYGPYTIEELTQYVSEGSLLPNDYVHNGMEWVHLSEFLKNPHRAATSMQSVSSAANAKPDWNSSTSRASSIDFVGIIGKFIKWGALSAIVFFGVYYLSTFMLNNTYVKVERPTSSKFSLSGDILYHEGSPYTGTKSEFYPEGKKKTEKYYKNGKKYGISTAWYENGQDKIKANFKDGLPDGMFTIWYDNGEMKSQMEWDNGILNGVNKVWYDNGQMLQEAVFVNGIPEGNFKVWRQNGDSWFNLESNNAEVAKVWNAKGELIDDESSEIIIEKNNFKKLLDELMKQDMTFFSR